ncbi:MAG: nitroreductase family protein [Ruminococcus sp.]|nr:nitroreductase family protein [Ruminococcus sp.]
MTELQAIRERHSVRSYQKKPIEPQLAQALKERIDELNEKYDLHMQYIEPAGAVFSAFTNKFTGFGNVPAYIAMIGKREEGIEERCGFVGEQLVLYAQTLGLNTCWAGMFKRRQVTAEIGEGEKLVLVIAIGYGVTGGRPRRSKKIEDVTDVRELPDWFKNGIEAALLAPTAVNQQKFFFTLEGDIPSVKVSANGPFVKLDLGIVKYHFEVGSGRKVF